LLKDIVDPVYMACNPAKKRKGCHAEGFQKDFEEREPYELREGHLLALLGFGPSAWRLTSRDDYIGWSDEQRIANLHLIVNNVRFLILPWIRSPNLASRILGGITRQLPKDWEARYGYRPLLIETFVQSDRFRGTCYKAANWVQIGTTNGYNLVNRERKIVPAKAILIYPLNRSFRRILCDTMDQSPAHINRQVHEIKNMGTRLSESKHKQDSQFLSRQIFTEILAAGERGNDVPGDEN